MMSLFNTRVITITTRALSLPVAEDALSREQTSCAAPTHYHKHLHYSVVTQPYFKHTAII